VTKLFTITRDSYLRSTESVAVIGIIVVVVLILAITIITPIYIGLSLQQEMELFAFKHVLGNNPANEHDKQMNILPCDSQHECQASI
jgi:hypothetical protein